MTLAAMNFRNLNIVCLVSGFVRLINGYTQFKYEKFDSRSSFKLLILHDVKSRVLFSLFTFILRNFVPVPITSRKEQAHVSKCCVALLWNVKLELLKTYFSASDTHSRAQASERKKLICKTLLNLITSAKYIFWIYMASPSSPCAPTQVCEWEYVHALVYVSHIPLIWKLSPTFCQRFWQRGFWWL